LTCALGVKPENRRMRPELLKLAGALVLATWEHDYLKGAPAITENKNGQGKAVYCLSCRYFFKDLFG
jgi:beta-galactosidase GanA